MPEQHIIKGADALTPLPSKPVGELLFYNFVRNKIQHEAMIDVSAKTQISYEELFKNTCKIAIALNQYGLKQNDIIAVCSENSLYYLQPIIAAIYLGVITATISYTYTPREVLHALSIAKPKIVFCSYSCLSKILEIKNQAPYIEKIVILDSNNNFKNADTLNGLIGNVSSKHLESRTKNILLKNIDLNDQVALILYSSGTTGLPKGVMILQKSILVRVTQLSDPSLHPPPTNENVLSFLPLSHAFGLILCLGYIISFKRIVLISKFEENLYLETIQNYKITDFWIVPTIAVFLSKSPLVEKYDLSCIKDIGCAGSPLKRDTEELIKQRLKIQNVRQAYGLTESTLGIVIMPTNEHRPGSIGKVVSRMMAKVVDPETRESLGPNKRGELLFKGGLIMKGYMGNPVATATAIDKDGWLCTGDLGYYDEDQYFYVVDRLKELIKYKGYQVPPAELENILVSHPNIQDAGVVGIPDEIAGELPMAFVVKQPGTTLTEKEIEDFVAGQVAPQKRLHGGVVLVNQLPKSSLGKILRRELKEMIKLYTAKL